MKRIVAILVILASILSLAACKELTPEEKMSSIAAKESEIAVENSKHEAAIEESKADILAEIGKTKKGKQVVAVKSDDNVTEYRVVYIDKNGFADYMYKYNFYSVEYYKIHKNQEDFGSLFIPIKRDDDLRMIKFKREYTDESIATFDSIYDRYSKSNVWTLVE